MHRIWSDCLQSHSHISAFFLACLLACLLFLAKSSLKHAKRHASKAVRSANGGFIYRLSKSTQGTGSFEEGGSRLLQPLSSVWPDPFHGMSSLRRPCKRRRHPASPLSRHLVCSGLACWPLSGTKRPILASPALHQRHPPCIRWKRLPPSRKITRCALLSLQCEEVKPQRRQSCRCRAINTEKQSSHPGPPFRTRFAVKSESNPREIVHPIERDENATS